MSLLDDDFRKLGFAPEDIPHNVREIAEVIGAEAMMKLVEVYGGANLYIPREFLTKTGMRRSEIRKKYAAGMSTLELSLAYGISQRAVQAALDMRRR